MKIFKYLAVLLFFLPSLALAQPMQGTGEITGFRLFENGSYLGDCEAVDFFRGFTLSRNGTTCSVDNAATMINARKYLNCDGVHSDTALLGTLLGPGGACAGKTCVFDKLCTLFLTTPNTSAGGGTVANVAVGTKILADSTIKLAGRSCTGGLTPGAACPGGVSDCNGGTCDYDDTINSKEFAWNAGDTYKIFASTVKNSSCVGLGNPNACCREGTGNGVCDLESQGYEISGFTIQARQVENYGRCNNGGTEQGKACNPYCQFNAALFNAACSKDADCGSTTCVNAAQCPSGSAVSCTSAPFSVSGPGSIFLADFTDIAGVKVSGIKATDFNKGQGIAVGLNGEVSNVDLAGWSGEQGISPVPNIFGPLLWWPLNTVTAVTSGITGGAGTKVSDVKLRTVGNGIIISNKTFQAQSYLARPTLIANSFVYVTGNSLTGIGSAAPYTIITNNHVEMNGNTNEGIFLSSVNAAYSAISRNSVVLNGTTGGKGIDNLGNYVGIADNHVTGNATLASATAFKSGVVGGGSGFGTRWEGNSYVMPGATCIGVEEYSGSSAWVNGNGALNSSSGTHVIIAGDQQREISNSFFGSGAICIAPDPSGAGVPTNTTISGNRCYLQTGTAAIYGTTGWIIVNNYIAWMTGTGLVLGDDRGGGFLAPTGHMVVSGNQFFSATNGQSLIKYPVLTTSTATQNVTITGNLFHGTGTGLIGVDLSTSYNVSTSTPIDSISIIGNNFTISGIAIKYPATATGRITNVAAGPNQYSVGTTGVANYIETYGPRFPYETFVVNDSALGANTANFMPISGFLSTAITASTGVYQTFQAGDFGLFHCDIDTAAGSTKTRTVSLDVAGVSQKTCAMANPTVNCDSAANMTAVTVNQQIRYSLVNTAAVTASGIACRVRFYPAIF